jgi:hypothetical protein
VSFGMNMSTEDECSDSGLVEQRDPKLMTAVDHFHARKFKEINMLKGEKRVVLKVAGAGTNKKQRTAVKSSVQEAIKSLVQSRIDVQGDVVEHDDAMEMSKEGLGVAPQPLEADPKMLTGAHSSHIRKK